MKPSALLLTLLAATLAPLHAHGSMRDGPLYTHRAFDNATLARERPLSTAERAAVVGDRLAECEYYRWALVAARGEGPRYERLEPHAGKVRDQLVAAMEDLLARVQVAPPDAEWLGGFYGRHGRYGYSAWLIHDARGLPHPELLRLASEDGWQTEGWSEGRYERLLRALAEAPRDPVAKLEHWLAGFPTPDYDAFRPIVEAEEAVLEELHRRAVAAGNGPIELVGPRGGFSERGRVVVLAARVFATLGDPRLLDVPVDRVQGFYAQGALNHAAKRRPTIPAPPELDGGVAYFLLFYSGSLRDLARRGAFAPPRTQPTAVAGPDQVVLGDCAGEVEVELADGGSTDPQGEALSYRWAGVFGTLDGRTATLRLRPGLHFLELWVWKASGSPVFLQEGATMNADPINVTVNCARPASADSYLTRGQGSTNHGAEPVLLLRGGSGRPVVAFDLPADQSRHYVARASLVLHLAGPLATWGPQGGLVEARPLEEPFGELSVTWMCPDDADPSDRHPDCPEPWDGGRAGRASGAPAAHVRGQDGAVEWDVTADFLAGRTAWLLDVAEGSRSGVASYVSREAAAAAGEPALAPTLLIEYSPDAPGVAPAQAHIEPQP